MDMQEFEQWLQLRLQDFVDEAAPGKLVRNPQLYLPCSDLAAKIVTQLEPLVERAESADRLEDALYRLDVVSSQLHDLQRDASDLVEAARAVEATCSATLAEVAKTL